MKNIFTFFILIGSLSGSYWVASLIANLSLELGPLGSSAQSPKVIHDGQMLSAQAQVLGSDPVIAAAGDIACDPNFSQSERMKNGDCQMKATSDLLLDKTLAAVLPLGDLQYEQGKSEAFSAYDKTWGRVKSVSYPVVGNHEYYTPAAKGYYQYFGERAGAPSLGYYSYEMGQWHIIALNGNCESVGGCHAGSAQEQWLKADLKAHPAACTLAYWHQPRFSSGAHGSDRAYNAFWQALYQAGAEIVLNGHDHNYERFAPQTPSAQRDDQRGIREFVVGTGGKNLRPIAQIQPNSEVRSDSSYGVLKLTLKPQGYTWEFVPIQGQSFTDSGQGICHA